MALKSQRERSNFCQIMEKKREVYSEINKAKANTEEISASMTISKLHILFFLSVILSLHRPALSDNNDGEDALLNVINVYRTSINLTTLTKNDNAECYADELAEEFKKQPCITNSTGSASIPGTQPGFPNIPNLLNKCRLNTTVTRDGAIIPVCVPNHDATNVMSNSTKTQFSRYLNDSKFSGIGIGSEDNWVVVILTTSTLEGGFSPATNNNNSGAFTIGVYGVLLVLLPLFSLFLF